jgi:hypothetical protein
MAVMTIAAGEVLSKAESALRDEAALDGIRERAALV